MSDRNRDRYRRDRGDIYRRDRRGRGGGDRDRDRGRKRRYRSWSSDSSTERYSRRDRDRDRRSDSRDRKRRRDGRAGDERGEVGGGGSGFIPLSFGGGASSNSTPIVTASLKFGSGSTNASPAILSTSNLYSNPHHSTTTTSGNDSGLSADIAAAKAKAAAIAAGLQPGSVQLPAMTSGINSISAAATGGGGGIDGQSTLTPAAIKASRRVYVGNLPLSTQAPILQSFFNKMMIKSELVISKDGEPAIDSNVNRPTKASAEKCYGFVEFRSAEEATAALKFLDGVKFEGSMLKIRRTRDYVQPADEMKGVPRPKAPIGGIISTNVEDTADKIYLGNLPPYFDVESVQKLISVYGQLKAFNLVYDSSAHQSKGYCFFEYLDSSVTDKAVTELNGLEIDGKVLMCQRAMLGANTAAGASDTSANIQILPGMVGIGGVDPDTAVSSSALMTEPAGSKDINVKNISNVFLPISAVLDTEKLASNPGKPSRVLVILNAVSKDDLLEDDDYLDIHEDFVERITQEFDTPIKSIYIPRPNHQDSDLPVAGLGKIFIEFETPEAASKVQKSLEGETYSFRSLYFDYWDEKEYSNGILE